MITGETGPEHRWAGGWPSHLLVILCYLALYYFFTYPALHTFGSSYLCDAGDGLQNVWNMWWVKIAVESGRSPWFTDLLFYPSGITLVGATLNPFNGFVGIPLDWMFGPVVAHNTMIVFSFVSCGWFTLLLLRHLGAPFWPAAFGGATFTYSSYHLAHGLGHMQLVSLEWLPFFLWAFLRWLDRPGHARALLAASSLLLVMLCDYYYLLYSVMVGFLLFVHRAFLLRTPLFFVRRDRWPSLVTFVGTCLLLCGPLAYRLLHIQATDEFWGGHDAETYVNDLLGVVMPGPNWHFRDLTEWFWQNLPFWKAAAEASVEIKATVLGLCIYALCVARHTAFPLHARIWLIIGVCFWLLSLGPVLRINGHSVESVYMPYEALTAVFPPLKMGSMPIRFAVIYLLAASVLATFGLTLLFRERGRRRWLALPLVLVWTAESMTGGQPTTRPTTPAVFHQLARMPEGAVAGLPWNAIGLWYQTTFKKPMVLGYVARYSESVFMRGLECESWVKKGLYEVLLRRTGARYLVRTPQGRRPSLDHFHLMAVDAGYEIWVLADDPLAKNDPYGRFKIDFTPRGGVALHVHAPEYAGCRYFCAFAENLGPGYKLGSRQLQIARDRIFEIAAVGGNGTFRESHGVLSKNGHAVIAIDAGTLKQHGVRSVWYSLVVADRENLKEPREITKPREIVLR